MLAPPTRSRTGFEEQVLECLGALGLSMRELAARLTLPETELRALCAAGNPRLSEVQQISQALGVDLVYLLAPVIQGGNFNQHGTGNTQKIKVGKAAAHELARLLDSCRYALEATNRLVAAKDEIITLLRGGNNRPNQ